MTVACRGEVWVVDLGMAAKVRPGSRRERASWQHRPRALVTIVPHTTSPRQSQFEATATVPFLKAGVFDAQNLVTIFHAKLVRRLGMLGTTQFGIVERAMCSWLGLSSSGIDRSYPTP